MPRPVTALLSVLALTLGSAPASAQDEAPAQVAATVQEGRGPRIVLVPAPGSPWAVVQLHLSTGPAQPGLRPALPAFGQALAFGAAQYTRTPAATAVREAGGEVRVRVTADEVVVSDGVPADALSEALRAMDQRLRTRRRLLPAEQPISPLPGPAPLPAAVRDGFRPPAEPAPAAAAPAAGEGTEAPAPPEKSLRSLADALLTRDRAVVVVIGPEDEEGLRRLVRRTLRTTLPTSGVEPGGPLVPAAGEHVADEVTARAPARGPYSWLWIAAPGAGFSSDAERRGVALAAHLVGGEAGFRRDVGWVSLHVPLTDPAAAAAAEAIALARLSALADAPPAAADVERAVAALRGEGWRALTDPAALALALGRETRMRGAPVPLAALYEGATPDEVSRAARALLTAPRVVLRHPGAPPPSSPEDT